MTGWLLSGVLGALVAAVTGILALVVRGGTIKRERDALREEKTTRESVEEAASDAPKDLAAARDALAKRLRRDS